LTRTIDVIVSPQGETKIETKGFAGSECLQATTSLEKALGQRQAEQLTSEFHQVVTAALPNRQQT
jgi:hypothetical protein